MRRDGHVLLEQDFFVVLPPDAQPVAAGLQLVDGEVSAVGDLHPRDHRPPGKELDDYLVLLKKGLWRPTSLDVSVMNRDGTELTQITRDLGGANWAPFFAPDGKRIIFATNFKNPRGPNFDLYLINVDGTGLEQVTFSETFDGFPMFSPDGTKLVFASNRNSTKETDTNLFIADWVW